MEHGVKSARAPEVSAEVMPHEMHITKKYGKFHGHMVMSDGSEHHNPPMASMQEAHAAMAPHLGEPMSEVEPE